MRGLTRRTALAASALTIGALAAGRSASQVAPAPVESVSARLVKRARDHLHAIAYDGQAFSGPGWDMLVKEGRAAEFFLIGEEHGTSEIPVLSGHLFEALRSGGYNRLAIELSAPVASDLDAAARDGLDGVRRYCATYAPGPAFYSWKPEAELLAKVRATVPSGQQAIWGLDYEVLGDRQLIERLRARAPASARPALDRLDQASRAGYAAWKAEKDPGKLPMFALDPKLIYDIRDGWNAPDADSAQIIEVLAETLEINEAQKRSGWESNRRRADFNRKTLVRYLAEAKPTDRVMFKFGSTHAMRGVSWTGVFDIGSLAAEAAALRGGKSFHLLVGGGVGATHGSLNPVDMSVMSQPAEMLSPVFGLQFLMDVMPQTGLGLLDLRPLRALASSSARLTELNNPEAVRIIHGFDMLLVWNRTTPTLPL